MKKIMICLTVLAVFAFGWNTLSGQAAAEDGKFKKFLDNYFDAYFKFFPTSGTLADYYKYNDSLEDFSSRAVDRFHDALDGFNQEIVAKIDKTKLSPEGQIDYDIMVTALERVYIDFENLLPWEYNPLYYNTIFINSVHSVLNGDFAPLDARVKSATERCKQIPNLVRRAKDNLKTPAQIYTETAIEQMPAILAFFRNEAPALVQGSAGSAAFTAEQAKAVAALEDYLNFLKTEVLPRSTGNFRWAEAHSRLMRTLVQGNLTQDELVARSRADYNNIRREMLLVAISFHKIMYPEIDIERLQKPEEEMRDYIIQNVFNKIQTEHTTRDGFIAAIRSAADGVRQFLTEKNLVELPADTLAIEPMPAYLRGVSMNQLILPGPFQAAGSSKFLLAPIPEGWSAEKAASFLQEYNDFFIDFFTVQRVFPGMFVPAIVNFKTGSLVRKAVPNQALLRGWPVYIEEMLVTNGYKDYDLRVRLNQLKLMLKNVIDFQMELNIHQGEMTKEQVITYMTRRGFQTEAEAESKWNHILLNPGDAALAYIGFLEIFDLEKDYKAVKGADFEARDFLKALLNHGAVPLRNLKMKLTQ